MRYQREDFCRDLSCSLKYKNILHPWGVMATLNIEIILIIFIVISHRANKKFGITAFAVFCLTFFFAICNIPVFVEFSFSFVLHIFCKYGDMLDNCVLHDFFHILWFMFYYNVSLLILVLCFFKIQFYIYVIYFFKFWKKRENLIFFFIWYFLYMFSYAGFSR